MYTGQRLFVHEENLTIYMTSTIPCMIYDPRVPVSLHRQTNSVRYFIKLLADSQENPSFSTEVEERQFVEFGSEKLRVEWEAIPAGEYTFHPRYVNGTFLCKSEALQPEQSLVVLVRSNHAPLIVTAFVSDALTVECPSEPVPAKAEIQSAGMDNFNITMVMDGSSYPQNDGQMHAYKVVAERASDIVLSCADRNGRNVWTKHVHFVGKISQLKEKCKQISLKRQSHWWGL
jgi:hypothetical protein